MATETLTFKVQSDIGKTTKDAANLASEFKIMGVSLNTVTSSLKSVGKTAKASFSTISKGIKSTGIGLLLIAFSSLASFLTKTKRGAELLEIALAGIGAAANVLIDRFSRIGEAVTFFVKGDFSKGVDLLKGSFTGLGEEIANDTKNAIALKKAFVELRDSQRDLNVETAQRRAQVEALKLVAEDVSKSEEERLAAAEKAFNIENNLLNKRIANAKEALRIQQEEMALSENMAEDLDKEAELLINLANIRQESTTKQIELNNKINAIKAQVLAKEEADAAEEQARLDAELEAEKKRIKDKQDAEDKARDEKIAADMKAADTEKKISKAVADFREETFVNVGSAISAISGENTAISKGVAVAETIFNTQQGIMAAMGATSVADKLLPYPLRLANAIATGVMGAKAVATIMSTNPGSGGGGGGAGIDILGVKKLIIFLH